jgi:hypothetical protein
MATALASCAERIEELVGGIARIADPAARDAARELMESILELHGAGIERMVELTAEAGEPGEALIRRFAADDLVSALLILHDLHPDDLATRVRRALGRWHGSAELIHEFEGEVRVRLLGGGCELRAVVESAVREAAPDAVRIIIEESFQPAGFVPLAALGAGVSGAD